ncbi:predicted protein [Chaetomium globosum CBS 148.51]|uniref:Heterokaryon incompatibility domain-containing protein n=1 Tax=Chaetomium globosum (strain ATCC 6205 / CBS 148.51 / DSM 1962 / NBRC 6347 / NRRL 1970) TaxID=306901 RepID=Q2GX52_CHAGB|nr:uncharacterized protein CHGG_07452 [Chaetomium globosum CBS 148.51]EAQ86199.1 predicted protein [Chaetomium globosum CBS 148.51]
MYDALPNATSIRVLDLLEATANGIRCNMHVVDLDHNPAYAALSYTTRNPITVHERSLSDRFVLDHLEADNFTPPFERSVSNPTPSEPAVPEVFAVVDEARREYYEQTPEYGQNMPYERVDDDDSTPFVIEVNGCAVRVGENLVRFLVSLANLGTQMAEEALETPELLEARDTLCLPIWIDTICINQKDLDEKAAQVKLARAVFKSARQVLSWVGPSDRLGDLAVEAVNIILDYMHSQELRKGDRLGIALDRPLPEMFTLSSIIEMTAAHWFGLFAFFQRTWFRQAWAAVAVILAQQTYLIYGENMLDMALIVRVLSFLDNRGLSSEFCAFGRSFLTDEAVSDPLKHLTKVIAAVNLNNGEPSSVSNTKALVVEPNDIFTFIRGFHYIRRSDRLRLTSVLSALRDLDAADPRDKTFAFLSLADNDLGIVPDYGATVQDVYKTAALAMLEEKHLLRLLSQVQDAQNTKIPDLPSWVPDFSARLGRVPFDRGTSKECHFHPFGETLWNYVVRPDGTLPVVAIRVDTVCTATNMDIDPVPQILKVALGSPVRYPDEPLTWSLVRTNDGKSSEQLRLRTISRVEALWRTLLADNVRAEGYSPGEFAEYLGNGFASWVLQDILETRVAVHALAETKQQWVRVFGLESFSSKVTLWSAMYDGNQIVPDSEVVEANISYRDLVINKLRRRRQDEREQYQLDLHLGIPEPTVGIRHFPTANRLMECVNDPVDELDAEIVPENLSGAYRANARSRLTSEERKSAACFEERMRIATQGRSFFRTSRGRLGLGPKSIGNNPGCKDEVWILQGADVPFILRHEEGDRYRVVGEAYIHGTFRGLKPTVLAREIGSFQGSRMGPRNTIIRLRHHAFNNTTTRRSLPVSEYDAWKTIPSEIANGTSRAVPRGSGGNPKEQTEPGAGQSTSYAEGGLS